MSQQFLSSHLTLLVAPPQLVSYVFRYLIFIPPCYVYAIASSPKVAVSILAIGILYCFAAAVSLLLSLLKIGGLFYEKILCHTPSQK